LTVLIQKNVEAINVPELCVSLYLVHFSYCHHLKEEIISFPDRIGRAGSSRRTIKIEQLFEDREEYCQCSNQSF
jgi:hypothetical protein